MTKSTTTVESPAPLIPFGEPPSRRSRRRSRRPAHASVLLAIVGAAAILHIHQVIGVAAPTIGASCLIVLATFTPSRTRQPPDPTERAVAAATAAYVGLLAAGVLYARSPEIADETTRERLIAIALAFVAYSLVKRAGRVVPAARGVVAGTGALGALSSLHLVGIEMDPWTTLEDSRLAGPYLDSNFLAQALVAGVVVAAGFVIFDRDRWRLLGAVGVVLGSTGLVLTQSRGGYLALAVGLGVVALLARSRRFLLSLGAAVVIFVALAATGIMGDRFAAITSVADSTELEDVDLSAANRLRHLHVGWQLFQEYPLIGVGSGNYSTYYLEYSAQLPEADLRREPRSAHSLYIETAAEHGVIGLLLLMAIFGGVIATTAKAASAAGPSTEQRATVALLGGLSAWLAAATFLHPAHPYVLWFLLGAVFGGRRILLDRTLP